MGKKETYGLIIGQYHYNFKMILYRTKKQQGLNYSNQYTFVLHLELQHCLGLPFLY